MEKFENSLLLILFFFHALNRHSHHFHSKVGRVVLHISITLTTRQQFTNFPCQLTGSFHVLCCVDRLFMGIFYSKKIKLFRAIFAYFHLVAKLIKQNAFHGGKCQFVIVFALASYSCAYGVTKWFYKRSCYKFIVIQL